MGYELLTKGATVSFELVENTAIPRSINNAVVMANAMDGTTAADLGTDIQALHAAVLPSIPTAPKSAYDCTWYRVRLPTGEKILYAKEWIVESSIVVQSQQDRDIRLIGVNGTTFDQCMAAIKSFGVTAVAL